MEREALERPFEAALVKTRRGAFGQTINHNHAPALAASGPEATAATATTVC